MGGAGRGHGVTPYPHSLQKLKIPKGQEGEGTQEEGLALLQALGRRCGGRWDGPVESSEPGLARSPRLLQTVATAQAVSGDLPEDGEHGVPDSVCQSWDVIWCQPFCGYWGQHPHLTSSWWGEEQRHDWHSWALAT